jgi:hypothetical protein
MLYGMYAAIVIIILVLAWTLLPHEQGIQVDVEDQDDGEDST